MTHQPITSGQVLKRFVKIYIDSSTLGAKRLWMPQKVAENGQNRDLSRKTVKVTICFKKMANVVISWGLRQTNAPDKNRPNYLLFCQGKRTVKNLPVSNHHIKTMTSSLDSFNNSNKHTRFQIIVLRTNFPFLEQRVLRYFFLHELQLARSHFLVKSLIVRK